MPPLLQLCPWARRCRWRRRLPPPTASVATAQCSALLDAAVCCGIDAEWPPVETAAEARGGGPPHATLVQLALWLPAGAAAPHGRQTEQLGSGSACVLLLDMMALPAAAAKHALQRLFRWA